MIALLQRALAHGRSFRVPAEFVGQTWRDGRIQVTLARFLRSQEVKVIPLDEELARSFGELCGASIGSPDHSCLTPNARRCQAEAIRLAVW
jgi:hypothetical protein